MAAGSLFISLRSCQTVFVAHAAGVALVQFLSFVEREIAGGAPKVRKLPMLWVGWGWYFPMRHRPTYCGLGRHRAVACLRLCLQCTCLISISPAQQP
jgi:hypothetical protein